MSPVANPNMHMALERAWQVAQSSYPARRSHFRASLEDFVKGSNRRTLSLPGAYLHK